MAAGGGFVTRELHSGRDEVIFHAQHPIIWNGVPDLANPAGLSDPALNVTLAPIAPEARRTERELFADVEAARPAILGGLRDAVSSALRNRKTVAVERVERRADFGMWVAAAEPGLGWEPGNFMAAHRANRAGAVERTVESDPVASAVVKLAERVMLPWEGSASELLAELDQEVKEKIRASRIWPGTPAQLANRLRRAAPNLRQIGIEVELGDRATSPIPCNSPTARSTRFHTARLTRSPFSSMASARAAASIDASSPWGYTRRLVARAGVLQTASTILRYSFSWNALTLVVRTLPSAPILRTKVAAVASSGNWEMATRS